ncbi:MAG TPA: HDOD domain-containing protein [Bacteroidota bacterium]|nr:HDOD domain-containing protein [Bacteroidota bacterium]
MNTAVETRREETISQPASIVVIDDEPAILASLTSLLRRLRLSVHAFESQQDALAYVRANPVTLILSDMRMPGMSGEDVLRRVEQENPDAVRILMSGHENKDDILAAISRGVAQFYVFKPWDDDALRETLAEAVRVQSELSALRLKEALTSLGELPSPSRFQTGLWELLSKPEKPIHELAEEIERSPALVAKLLRVANSVFFGARQKVTTVMDAIRLVGTQYVVSMAISIEAMNAATSGISPDAAAHVERIWERSLRRTHLAKKIASRWGNFQQVHALSIASLLQDIGMIILICYRPDAYARYSELLGDAGESEYALQRQVFGITHEKLGEAVLEYWNFPKEISTAVGRHHGSTEGDTMATILQVANILEDEREARPYDETVLPLVEDWKPITTS